MKEIKNERPLEYIDEEERIIGFKKVVLITITFFIGVILMVLALVHTGAIK